MHSSLHFVSMMCRKVAVSCEKLRLKFWCSNLSYEYNSTWYTKECIVFSPFLSMMWRKVIVRSSHSCSDVQIVLWKINCSFPKYVIHEMKYGGTNYKILHKFHRKIITCIFIKICYIKKLMQKLVLWFQNCTFQKLLLFTK